MGEFCACECVMRNNAITPKKINFSLIAFELFPDAKKASFHQSAAERYGVHQDTIRGDFNAFRNGDFVIEMEWVLRLNTTEFRKTNM